MNWVDYEVDYLRQELDEMENVAYQAAVDRKALRDGEIRWHQKTFGANAVFVDKVSTYLQIIEEYAILLNAYKAHTNVKLDTTRLKRLLKQGELTL